MQYFSKVVLLAIAFFGVFVLALPLQVAPGSQYDLEARELNNDLSSRGFYDMYLDARDDTTLDARSVSLFGLKSNFCF